MEQTDANTPTRRGLAHLAVGATTLASGLPAQAAEPRVRIDHHVHVHAPEILAFLPEFCTATARFGKCDAALTQPLTVADLLHQMDEAGVGRALIMSTAYLAESPMMQALPPNHVALVRAANDFTVGLARRYPQRIGAFVGVNALSDTALPEIARWRGNPHVSGLKLHATNAMLDLRSERDLQRLATVFAAAADNRLAVMIHLRTMNPDYGAEDVRNFVRAVVPAARGGPIQIAHAAGWGSLDANTLAALGAFADALRDDPALARSLWFDLAGVWKVDSPAADKAALVALIRRIGPDRFVPASDWPFFGDLKPYYETVYPALPLSPSEWRTIRGNAPGYARASTIAAIRATSSGVVGL